MTFAPVRPGAPVPWEGEAAVDEAAGPAAAALGDWLRDADLVALARAVGAAADAGGMRHVALGVPTHVHVDPVPRVIAGAEWDRLAAGLAQRVRALEAFLRDPTDAVRAGVVPADVVGSSIHRAPDVPAPAVPLGVAGPDIVRAASGDLVVLEDNLRTPTLMGYAQAVASFVRPHLPPPTLGGGTRRPALDGLVPALAAVLAAAAQGDDVRDPVVAVLGDRRGSVRWEPARIAAALGVPLVDLDELTSRSGRLLLPDGRPVDVLWRRTSEERLVDDAGRLNAYGEALLPALRAGRLAVVNPFGTGIADDKRTFPYVEDLVRHHLGEEPLLRSVRSYDLGDPPQRAEAWDRLDTLVLKPRAGCGGHGVVVMRQADRTRRDRAVAAVRADPASWTAQETVELSTCPTVVDGRLQDRRVDLRPCVLSTGADVTVLSGGMTRVAMPADGMIVNFSQGGAAKDTWVIDR